MQKYILVERIRSDMPFYSLPVSQIKDKKSFKCESTEKQKCSNCQHLKSNNFGMLLHRIDTNDALKDI